LLAIGWDIFVGIAKGYGLNDRGSIPGKSKRFSLLQGFLTSSGPHPATYLIGIWICFNPFD
jgi:hypothetical protein